MFSNNLGAMNFAPDAFIGIAIKVLILIMLIMYGFFSLFLYLRVKILSNTLRTPTSSLVRYVAFLHLLAVIGIDVFLSLLLLF